MLIVGCGRIAGGYNEASDAETLTHVVAYRRAGAEVVGCCDADADAAARFAARWQVPSSGVDLRNMLADLRPDVVSVATPAGAQEQVVTYATDCATVRAMLLEKPLGADGAAAERIANRLESWGGDVVVNYFRAFDRCYRAIEDEARAGLYGALRQAVGRYYGAARVNASHLLERIVALLGEPRRVEAVAMTTPGSPAFVLHFGDGVTAMFLPSDGLEYAPFELDLLFERARIRVVDGERRIERFGVVPDPDFPGYSMLAMQQPGVAPSLASFARPFDAIVAAARGEAAHDRAMVRRAVAITAILDQVLLQGVS